MADFPRWASKLKHNSDPTQFEETDARSLSEGRTGRTPGSGRLFPGQLDSEVDDFKTDNKVVGKNRKGEWARTKSYTIDRDFWLERIQKSQLSGLNFRESILFAWSDEGSERHLHIVAVEGNVFEEIYKGYKQLFEILENKKSVDQVREEMTVINSNAPKW